MQRKLSLGMIRSALQNDERAIEQQLMRPRPQDDGPIDARLALAGKTVLRLSHRGRKNGEKYVAIVCLAQRIL